MAITYGNPVIITSGTYSTQMEGNYKINRVVWHQPGLQTSGVLINRSISGNTLLEMVTETSGQTQTLDFRSTWWNRPYVQQVPTGTLYLYME